jgi:hypothetical protein
MVPRDEGHCAVKQAVESLGRESLGAMVAMATMRYITDRALLQERLTAILSGFFGTLALLLAGVGLYGLMAYAVAQRQREIAIRVALGADTARIMPGVIRDGLAVSLGGVGVGLTAALGRTGASPQKSRSANAGGRQLYRSDGQTVRPHNRHRQRPGFPSPSAQSLQSVQGAQECLTLDASGSRFGAFG